MIVKIFKSFACFVASNIFLSSSLLSKAKFLSGQSDEIKARGDIEIEKSKFYFVHSYYVEVEEEKERLMTTHYGSDFDSAIIKNNIFGVQFHPEKSHKFGMQLFKNFSQL